MNRRSIFISWLASYVLILLIPIIVSVFIYFRSEQAIRTEIDNANMALLKQVQQDMDTKMTDVERMYNSISFDDDIKSLLDAKSPISPTNELDLLRIIKDKLPMYTTTNKFVSQFYIYFKNIDCVLTANAKYDLHTAYEVFHSDSGISYENWYTAMRGVNDRNTISELAKGIIYLSSIFKDSQDSSATFVVKLDRDMVENTVKNMQWYKNSNFLVIDEMNGVILSSSGQDMLDDLKFELFQKNSGSFTKKIAGKKYVMAYISSAIMNWKYVLVVPEDILFKKAVTIMNIAILGLIASLMFGSGLAYLFSRKNYNPVWELTNLFKGDGREVHPNEYEYIKHAITTTLNEKEQIEKKLMSNRDIIFSNFLVKLLRGRVGISNQIDEFLNSYHITLVSDKFAVILIKIEDYSGMFANDEYGNKEERLHIVHLAISNISEELIEKDNLGFVTEIDDMIACIINLRDSVSGGVKPETAESIAIRINRLVREYLLVETTVTVSNIHTFITGISQCYQETLDAMEYKIVFGAGEVIKFADIKPSDGEYYYSVEEEIQLINCIKVGDYNKAKELISHIINEICENNNPSIEIARCLMFDLMGTMLKAINAVEGNTGNKGLLWNQLSPEKTLMGCETIIQMNVAMESMLQKVCDYIEIQKKSHNLALKDEVKNYIEENYSDANMSVALIAEHFKKNPTYLSRFFKEHIGEGLLDYINKVRIMKAKQLLKETQMNINEVSQQTGFINSAALIRVFKKYEGITPGQFKNQ